LIICPRPDVNINEEVNFILSVLFDGIKTK
jgi:hypothetical protein